MNQESISRNLEHLKSMKDFVEGGGTTSYKIITELKKPESKKNELNIFWGLLKIKW